MSFFISDRKTKWFVDATWISFPGPISDDLPAEFDLDDFDGEPDLEGMARAQRQKGILTIWETRETSTANAPGVDMGPLK